MNEHQFRHGDGLPGGDAAHSVFIKRQQCLIELVRRAGGRVQITGSEIEAAQNLQLDVRMEENFENRDRTFTLTIKELPK